MESLFKKVDDDAYSIESFEDVGSKPMTITIRPKDTSLVDEGPVPDVLYVVQYRNVRGRIVETRKSDKPLDVTPDTRGDTDTANKKPVIEILTQVTATLTENSPPWFGGPTHAPPPPGWAQGGGGYPGNDVRLDADQSDRNVRIDKVETTEMVIHSPHLQCALNAVVGYYPGVDFIGERVAVQAPYQVLMHCRKELELYKVNQPPCHDEEYAATTAKHIDVLLSYLKTTFGDKVDAEEGRWNQDVPIATFELFWLLLKPGEVVYTKEDNHWSAGVISSVGQGPCPGGGTGRRRPWVISYWNIEYAVNCLQRRMKSVLVQPFSGEQAIRGLNAVPARFFPGGARAAAEKQIRLGREYWELSKSPSHKEYDAETIQKDGNTRGKVQGRVIVDSDGYHQLRDTTPGVRPRPPQGGPRRPGMGMAVGPAFPPLDQLPQIKPRCPCPACRRSGGPAEPGLFAGFDNLNPNKDAPPENELYFHALSDIIPAFVLADRRWGMVEVEHLREVRYDREAFRYLVLDDEIKLTVRALIGKFANEDGKVSPWPSDFVRNKGEGRIFLLHGSPGVGKTCTAECVAELTHRPLLSLTSGDISTTGTTSSVERNLDFFLKLGERYGALVLLDEADVYLEERRTRDLHRNGLVSIFLRALEYYRGVLFLTTNRVEAFDSAFTSRIHVALHYKRLTDEDRARIWTHQFERLERDSGGKAYVPQSARVYCYDAPDVRALRWNGREIRNALQTAVALAESEALENGVESVTITDKHLRAVVKMSRGFKDYLRKHRAWDAGGGDDDEEDPYESSSEGEIADD